MDEADFSYAHIDYAKLSDVSFRRAAFWWNKLAGSTFADVDFGGATGLPGNRIWAVTIDTLTLDRTAATLAMYPAATQDMERFYREAEVPEHVIEYYRSRIGMTRPYLRAFISYSSADREFARLLHEHLTREGVRCTLDEVDFRVLEEIHSEISRWTKHSDRMLLCCSRNALTSPWGNDEIVMALALERDRQKSGRAEVFLLPVMLDDYMLDGYTDGKADLLRARVAADFRDWSSVSFRGPEFRRLLTALGRSAGKQ